MKKNMFTLIIAAAAMVASTTLVSCEKSLEQNKLPEVIESEVLESGKDEAVTVTSGAEGTALSYESWIVVRQVTRSGENNRIAVKLENRLTNLTAVQDVNTFVSEVPTDISLEKIEKASRQEGYVTIIDSAMVIKVRDAHFEFGLELPYQIPIYDDGVTRQEMPCYRYEHIYSQEAYTSFVEVKEMDGNAYACRVYHHGFEVVFGGESYEVNADITLRYYLGPASEPYITKSEVMGSWSEWSSTTSLGAHLNIRHTWSNGTVTNDEYVAPLGMYIDSQNFMSLKLDEYGNDLKLKEEKLSDKERSLLEKDGYISIYRSKRTYSFEYNYFTVYVDLIEDDAIYEDGLISLRFEEYSLENISNGGYTLTEIPYTSGDWNEYNFVQKVNARCLGRDLEGNAILTLMVKHK